MLLIIAFLDATLATIPKSLLVPNRSYPPQKPVNVRLKIDVQQTQMDFQSATLYVHGTTTLTWTDTRKSWLPSEEGENTFSIDAALTPGEFRHIYGGLWIPNIKNRFTLLTFKSVSNLYSDHLSFTSNGVVSHDFRFMLMIACLINDINYPYDIYECYERLGEYERNTTVRYVYATSLKQFMTVSENACRSGHKITSYISYKNVTDMGLFDSEFKNFFPESIDIGFTVQRHQPRLIINLIIPIYCITLMDGFIFVFGRGMQRACLLPVYATYFGDISTIYTIAKLPHIELNGCVGAKIQRSATGKDAETTLRDKTDTQPDRDILVRFARWFFARLFSSSVCLGALFFVKNKLACYSQRFLAIAVSTVVFYAIFSIPFDSLHSSSP